MSFWPHAELDQVEIGDTFGTKGALDLFSVSLGGSIMILAALLLVIRDT